MKLVPKAEFSIVTRASKAWIPDLIAAAGPEVTETYMPKRHAQLKEYGIGPSKGSTANCATNVLKLCNSSNIITVGNRHNALVAAALLARTGNRVLAMVPMPGRRITTFIYRDLRQSKLQK